jgi:hypothetical protein
MERLQRLIAVLLAFSKTEPEKPSDNECSWISGTVVLVLLSLNPPVTKIERKRHKLALEEDPLCYRI